MQRAAAESCTRTVTGGLISGAHAGRLGKHRGRACSALFNTVASVASGSQRAGRKTPGRVK